MVLNKGKWGKFEKKDWKSKTGGSSGGPNGKFDAAGASAPREDSAEARIRLSIENDAIDNKYGFERIKGNVDRVGWLLNFHPTEVLDEDKRLVSGVDYYFIQDDGSRFKATYVYQPYFYVLPKAGCEKDVQLFLTKKYGGFLVSVELVSKEDLDLPNHLVGLKRKYLKLCFLNVHDLLRVRRDILPAVRKNREREKSNTAYADMLKQSYIGDTNAEFGGKSGMTDHLENIVDIREYDVPYHMRVSIDKKIFVGVWYQVTLEAGLDFHPVISLRKDIIEPADCIVLAYDIETTKLPLKFPDASFDQIMMISYMIDGQGYLITNREIVSSDVDDFEYTPKPEFEGQFIIFNEQNEMCLLQRFFDHILDVRPHIFSTYNGDFFDWPFVEARATTHGLNMLTEIGFSEKDGVYSCRPCIHMDCFNWVKRDSYLPVGSQNLKAVAKAKLRYDPVELDPEDMCRMAAEQPQVLSTYSVSDAVATYYLYMKYVHPFIFALCTIIPMEPDEILRKGSGTLCEALLMVEAFHANIIFPNKQESILNKMTSDGHVLESETYVGGHVEALESGVFRSDIPCRFKLVPEAFSQLLEGVENTIKHAIEEEEQVPIDKVLNFDEIVGQIKTKLISLRDNPVRQEFPLIYHLDVGAMYPNIILTNRLQPSAMVDEVVCAACDFNKPGVKCQREMAWTWRGEYMPATRSEFQRIQQQLEMERYPPLLPGSRMRAFHELNKEERAAWEKKRLSEYCRKAYKKAHITQVDVRHQTVCQQENSFYVDTVRAFRDRRYEYKGFSKVAKKEVADAITLGDVSEIKSAKNREVLYDSLQLAYKCILNSFYGYVMRKGARWHSMEMAGIVCHTGSNIIRKAREIIEKVGRPLELDTDGIWCVLPSSFPENFTIRTSVEKKATIKISYPNAVLNLMVKDEFTNDQYHELVDKNTLRYEIRNENSIFFEVDGPYLAMILPASKEEGKKLKKRYAVFNADKSLAELKGFEVKRRGELHLIKNFQSSVFDAFLKGDTLEACYAAVAKVADYWLDVLYSKAADMPDSELFELISENRSMSRKLEDYGQQKSTSISTAKRLAEFLGDQMVKDAGLSCRFIISRKPDGAPVTERAIPLAIFQAEPSVKRHFIRRWLKDNSINDFDIRSLLDWDYYIERLSGTIQKIVTIPAALQGVSNPVPRVLHPDWLHKRILEKTDILKQRKINEVFFRVQKPSNADDSSGETNVSPKNLIDIEEAAGGSKSRVRNIVINSKRKRRDRSRSPDGKDYSKTWKEVLGPAPLMGDDKESIRTWLAFHKKKWDYQKRQKEDRIKRHRLNESDDFLGREDFPMAKRAGPQGAVTIGGFLRRTQQTLLDSPWQILQVTETPQPGIFKLWALVGQELHQIRLKVPRIFYVNLKEPKPFGEGEIWRKCNRTLPRAHAVYNLYEYSLPEEVFKEASNDIFTELSTPNVEGIYESQVPLSFRVLLQLGCVCSVDRQAARKMKEVGDTFELNQLNFRTITAEFPYMDLSFVKLIYLYQHKSGNKSFFGLFFPTSEKATVFTVDTVRTNQMPNLNNLYNQLRNERLNKGESEESLPVGKYTFDVKIEKDVGQVFRQIQRLLQGYKDEKKGPTVLVVQTQIGGAVWPTVVPIMNDFPVVTVHASDHENLYHILEWQRVASRMMFKHFFRVKVVLTAMIDQCRYFQSPIGNIPHDTTLFGCDLLYARNLLKQNFVLWCSPSERPDLGGKEADDNRLITEIEEYNSIVINNPGCYQSVCIELELDGMAVNTLLQAHHVHDIEGMSSTVAFDTMQQASLEEMMGNAQGPSLASYDETALCSNAFRVLRATVSSWLRDVSVHRNLMADYQLIHFYRWLRSPHSLLYDPALKKTLHNLMKKLFIQLVAEFMRLGSTIVYADFSKIIICTKKTRVSDAVGYVEYVTHSIKNKELFHSIDIKMHQCWEHLIWLDSANYGAIKAKIVDKEMSDIEESVKRKLKKNREGNSEEILSSGGESEEEEELELEELNLSDEEIEPEIEMKWSLTNYLPDVGNCKINFSTAIASYILAIHKHLSNEMDSFTPGHTPVRKRSSTQTPRRAHNNPLLQNTVQFARQLIQGELAQKLFQIVQKLNKKFPLSINPSEAQSTATYRVPYYAARKPALEFVMAIHKVLSLDPNIENEVYKLRRNLLKLIGVGEFSDESQWSDPCMSIVLPEVICKVCIQCRDIDLCKDPYITMENDLPVWSCPTCKANYETAEIEQDLVDIVNRKMMGYVLQDLQCSKCQQIKEDNMFLYCTCAGKLKTLIDVQQTSARLKTFRGIAKHFGMPLLLQNVEWLLKMNPHLESI